MWKIRPRIPSLKALCVLYVMVNLMKVNRTSIAVAVVLTILFCVNVQVMKAKHVRTHTQRHWKECLRYPEYAFYSPNNHGEGVAIRKLIAYMRQVSAETSKSE